MAISLRVNGVTRSVDAEPDTPLLYVLRNDLELNGAKYGCALTQCGACTVLVNGAARRSCVTPTGSIEGNEVTTLEGLGTLDNLHPLQKAFIDEIRSLITGIKAQGWLPEDLDVEAFLMVMLALPFGLIFQDLDPSFEVDLMSSLKLLVPRPSDAAR